MVVRAWAASRDANYGHGIEPTADGKVGVRLVLGRRLHPARPHEPGDTRCSTGRTVYPADADGEAHSSPVGRGPRAPVRGRRGLLQDVRARAPRRATATCAYTTTRTRPHPVQIGAYRDAELVGRGPTRSAATSRSTTTVSWARTSTSSWYTDGVRVIDAATRGPGRGRVLRAAGRPATRSSRRSAARLTNTMQVWGVVVDEMSEMN